MQSGRIRRALAVARVEAKEAEQPQIILSQTRFGITDKTHQPKRQIFAPAEIIMQHAIRAKRHGIDGEIASRCIFAPIGGPSYFSVAAIGQHVTAQRRHFNRLMIPDRRDCAMCEAGLKNLAAGSKQARHDFFRRKGCGDIHIRDRQPGQGIAHGTTHRAATGQGIKHLGGGGRTQKIRQ